MLLVSNTVLTSQPRPSLARRSLELTTDAVIMSVVVIDNEGGIFDTDTLIHTLQEVS